MKRNSSLLLIELVIMLLVFSLAAALCVQVFVWADTRSAQSAVEDMALLQAQNAAEALKHCNGDFSLAAQTHGGVWAGKWTLLFDEQWTITEGDPSYRLVAEPVAADVPMLGQAKLTVWDREGAVLAELSVCWQEVAP